MIEFLKRELQNSKGRMEASVRFTGVEGSICLLIIDLDDTGFVYENGGRWHCDLWHEVAGIYKPIPEFD